MTTDEKLAAILAAVQTDPGNRGLARVPGNNLFTATAGDFEAACHALANSKRLNVSIKTGFFIPSSDPPCFETDGPLGALFLQRAIDHIGGLTRVEAESAVWQAISSAYRRVDTREFDELCRWSPYFQIWVERGGPAIDGKCYTMRGRDITEHMELEYSRVQPPPARTNLKEAYREYIAKGVSPESLQQKYNLNEHDFGCDIGIGDGGNEVGMGRIPHDTVVANIPNGDQIHCRETTDHLIVAGVSNWGAYALAAGLFVLLGDRTVPENLFDPDCEKTLLEQMVREGPLVDGVTGKQTATVDGLSWDEYVKPLIRIREILAS
jgi:hypothetical protein